MKVITLQEANYENTIDDKIAQDPENAEKIERQEYDGMTRAEFDQMVGSPLKKSGEPKTETWLLIKLYEATIWDPASLAETTFPITYRSPRSGALLENYGITRSSLLKMCGTAMADNPAQSQTYLNLFRELGLAYLNPSGDFPGYIFPGENLQDWIEGKDLKLEVPDNGKSYEAQYHKGGIDRPYGGGVDLRIFVGRKASKKTPASSRTKRADGTGYGDDPFAAFPGIKIKPTTKSTQAPVQNTKQSQEQPQEDIFQDGVSMADLFSQLGMNEGLDYNYSDAVKEQHRKNASRKAMAEQHEKYMQKYTAKVEENFRKYAHLNESMDLNDASKFVDFEWFCCCHNYPVNETYKLLFGKERN